jgi:NAD-dependent dihydropyrimidine dehydrogenase PreA subunit
MAKRKIIEIDEDKCTGCGACVTKCAEGALAIIDGKARVVNEVFCDGLGACIGECPEGALRIIDREAPEFDEEAVNKNLSEKRGHEHSKPSPIGLEPCGCPSHNPMLVKAASGHVPTKAHKVGESREELPPELTNWPIQWRLIRPDMPFFKGADVLMAADCVPFAFRDFHGKFLAGRPVIVGCPKLDDQERYLEKLTDVVANSGLKSIDVVIMEVPCCGGLKRLVDEAVRRSGRDVPVKTTVVGIQGQILRET